MKLPYEIASLEAVEEQYRGLYSKSDDGKFKLAVSGLPSSPSKEEIDTLKAKAAQAEKFAELTEEDLDTIQKAKAGKLIQEGKLLEYAEERVTKASEGYKTKILGLEKLLTEANKKIGAFETSDRDRRTQDLLGEQFQKQKYQPRTKNAQGMVYGLLAKNWAVNDAGELEGLATDGTPLLSKENPGERMKVDEAIRGVVQENPFLFLGSDGKQVNLNKPSNIQGVDFSDPEALGKFGKSLQASG